MRIAASRAVLAVVGVLAGASCDDCSWFAPEASRTVEVRGHRIRIDTLGTRDIGVDGFGAPHVGIGILWPEVEGYGYRFELTVDERPTVVAGTASFDGDRVPSRAELARFAASFEVTLAPNGQHLAYRRDGESGYRVLHLLSKGTPFDSADSDRFATSRVPAQRLDFGAFPSSTEIALRILRDEEERRAHQTVFFALSDIPPSAPLDDAVLAVFPSEPRAADVLLAYVRPSSHPRAAFRTAVLESMISGLDSTDATDRRVYIVEVSEDQGALRRVDERLLELFPRADVVAPLEGRIASSRRDPSRQAWRDRARARAMDLIARSKDDAGGALDTQRGIRLVVALEGRDAPPSLFEPLAAKWPANAEAHRFLMENVDELPEALRQRLEARARAHLGPHDPFETRAAAFVCRRAMKAHRCAEVAELVPRSSDALCHVPATCE